MAVCCPLGGPAPCIDDLCHGVDRTICGLYRGFDFCEHNNDPDQCATCLADDDEYGDFDDDNDH